MTSFGKRIVPRLCFYARRSTSQELSKNLPQFSLWNQLEHPVMFSGLAQPSFSVYSEWWLFALSFFMESARYYIQLPCFWPFRLATRLRGWDSQYPILEDVWFFPFLILFWLFLRSKGSNLLVKDSWYHVMSKRSRTHTYFAQVQVLFWYNTTRVDPHQVI